MSETTLYSYQTDKNVTLEESIINCKEVLQNGVALLYSPQSCQFLRLTNQKLQDSNAEEKEIFELSDIFEARIFNKQCELRWLNCDNGNGRAVLLSELKQSLPGFTLLKPISCESLKQQYLLWGKGVKKDDNCSEGWQRLAEARIGKLYLPLNTTLEESQQVYLETREYIAEWVNNEDSNSENYGNVAVIEERLVELKPKPLEVKK